MTSFAKNRWAWAGVIWLTAVAIAFWNHQKIDSILSVDTQNQALQQEIVFLQQHGRRLESIQQEYAKLFLPVESVQLGVLSAQSAICELAGALELASPQFTTAPIARGDETAGLNIALEGPLEKITLFLSGITRLQYLEEKHSTIKIELERNEAKCDLSMVIRCRLQSGREKPLVRRAEPTSAL